MGEPEQSENGAESDASGAESGASGAESDASGAEADASGDEADASPAEADIQALRADVRELEETLDSLQAELRNRSSPLRPPSLPSLRRFTTEVTIPMAILVLETNVRALRILRRALRADEAASDAPGTETAARVGREAAAASRGALDRLDRALSDLRASVADEGDVDGLLTEASRLQERVEAELERLDASERVGNDNASGPTDDAVAGEDAVPVDVDAELESIRTQVNDEADDDGA